jgi:beta-galactosidase
VDLIWVETDLTKYDIVIAPVLYMVKPGYARRLEEYVSQGGTFLTTFFSGIVNETDLVTVGGYPGELRALLGIWVEEIDALFPDQQNRIVMQQDWADLKGEYSCNLLCDLLHTEGAEVIAEYGADFYKGMPVVTKNSFGKGQAWYVAASPDQAFLKNLITHLAASHQIEPLLETPQGVEVTRRAKDGQAFFFILNHNPRPETIDLGRLNGLDLLSNEKVSGLQEIPPRGVMILKAAD